MHRHATEQPQRRDQRHPVQSNVAGFAQLFNSDSFEQDCRASPPQRYVVGRKHAAVRDCSTNGGHRTPPTRHHVTADRQSPGSPPAEHSSTGIHAGCCHGRGSVPPLPAYASPSPTAVASVSTASGQHWTWDAMGKNSSVAAPFEPTTATANAFLCTSPVHAGHLSPQAASGQGGSIGDAKWNNISTIAECIIKEKDMIIEKQKLKRIQLEQQLRECEAQLQALILAHATDAALKQNDDLAAQEQEYEKSWQHASSLAAAGSIAKAVLEKSQLESKLGAAEQEISNLLSQRSSELRAAREREQQFTAKLSDKDAAIALLQRRFDEASAKMVTKAKKLQSLRRYLADLPTADDHRGALQKIRSLQEEVNLSQEHIEELRQKVELSHGVLRAREAEMKQVADGEREARDLVADLRRRLAEHEEHERIRRASGKADVVRLMSDVAELRQQCDRLSKVEEQHALCERRVAQMQQEHEIGLAALRAEADSLAEALRTEADEHGRQTKALSAAVWEVNQRNQDLMEELMSGKEQLAAAEKLLSSDERLLMTQCVDAVVCCTENLERLLSAAVDGFAVSRLDKRGKEEHSASAAGAAPLPPAEQEPRHQQQRRQRQQPCSLPLLLTHSEPGTINMADEAKHLRVQLSRLDSVRGTLNKLHRLVMNKYAEEMALSSDVECITQ